MKKTITLITRLLCVMLVLGILAACGNTGDTESGASSTTQSTVSASASSKTPSKNPSGNGSQGKYTAAQLASFEKFGHYGNPTSEYEILEGERDPWLWPFSRDSFWNMPIGSGAELVDTNWETGDLMLIDQEYFLTTKSTDKQMEIYRCGMNNKWPSDLSGLTKESFKTYWPTGVLIRESAGGNCCSVILQPDGRSVLQLQPTCYDDPTADYITGYAYPSAVDLYNSDGAGGTHWGSALSAIGGSIRLGELTSDEPIRHALKLTVSFPCLYFDWETMGFTWPATTADGHAQEGGYKSTNPHLLMGALLCLPKDLTAEELGITSPVGKKLFWTLQNYGCYIVDCSGEDNGRNLFNFCGDIEILKEVERAYGIQMNGARVSGATDSANKAYAHDYTQLIKNLKIVKNNSATSVAGGGTPCQPLAPNLPSVK